jgi:hypothetical protein
MWKQLEALALLPSSRAFYAKVATTEAYIARRTFQVGTFRKVFGRVFGDRKDCPPMPVYAACLCETVVMRSVHETVLQVVEIMFLRQLTRLCSDVTRRRRLNNLHLGTSLRKQARVRSCTLNPTY